MMLRAASAVLVTMALAAGCANAPAPPAPGPATGIAAPGAGQQGADVAYAQMMMPHLVQGVELTEMVPGRVADPAVAQLVQSMNYTDVEEQGQLAGQLHLWQAAVPGENGVPLGRMPGMADPATLDRLRGMSGPAFDQAWLAVMIAHHQGGVDMSRDYLARGADQGLGALAQTQVQVGGSQIAQMRTLQSQP